MTGLESLVAAGLLTACIGGTLIACFEFVKNYGKPLPPCKRCRCDHEDHEQRFGDPGHCHNCYCFRYERSA